jgi:hypothetical protein
MKYHFSNNYHKQEVGSTYLNCEELTRQESTPGYTLSLMRMKTIYQRAMEAASSAEQDTEAMNDGKNCKSSPQTQH